MGLFEKSIEPRCAYCAHGRPLDQEQIVCPRKGVMDPGSHCRSFRYDPLKRVPPRPAKPAGVGLPDEDFPAVKTFREGCPSRNFFSPRSPQEPTPFSPLRPGGGRRGPKGRSSCDMFSFPCPAEHYIMWS